jgi:hypothetical protein
MTDDPLNSLAWSNASKQDRTRFLEDVGLTPLLECMPVPMRQRLFGLVELEIETKRERPARASDVDVF